MSTTQTASAPAFGFEGRRVSLVVAMWNLFVKELRESRSALIVGVFAFWLMPVFVAAMASVFSSGREEAAQIFGALAYALLLSGGWLFAAAFGTHIVCRDWGRPEERFLLAQPVTPRWVMAAKLTAAVVVVAVVVLTLLLAARLLMFFAVDSVRRENLAVPSALVVCVVGLALTLSFSIAVVTRQSTASLVLTMLIMGLGIAAPLVSTRFAFLHPDWEALSQVSGVRTEQQPTLLQSWPAYRSFLASLVVCVVGSLTAAFVLCTRERAIRIGHKPLAWTVALAALLLFGAGMMEVGRSVDICDRVTLWGGNETFCRNSELYCEGSRGFAVATPVWGEGDVVSVADFDIDADGRVQSLRSGQLWHWANRISSGPVTGRVPHFISPLDATTRDKDRYRIVGMVSESGFLGGHGLCRFDVEFDAKGQLGLVFVVLAGEESDAADADSWRLDCRAWTDRYAYLLYAKYRKSDSGDNAGTQAEEEARRVPEQTVLRVYEWSPGYRGAKALEVILPTPCFFRQTTSSIVFHRHRYPSPIVGVAPLDDLEAIKSLFSKGVPESRDWSSQVRGVDVADVSRNFARRPTYSEVMVHQGQDGFKVKADQKGLIVIPVGDGTTFVPAGPVRTLRYSPLQSMFGWSTGGFQVIDSTLLAHGGFRSVKFYDLSDLFQARRAGFLNISSDDCPAIERVGDYLLVLAGQELAVVKRPKTARAGTATASDKAPYQAAFDGG